MGKSKPDLTYSALTKASEIMNRPVHTVRLSDSIRDVSRLFIEKNIGAAAVVDKYGIPIGVITKTDITRFELDGVDAAVLPQKNKAKKTGEAIDGKGFHVESEDDSVEEWMTPFISGVHPSTVLPEVAAQMEKNKLHHIFVTDKETGFVEGIITSYDLIRVLHVLLKQESRSLTGPGEAY